jgi:hypothetical protein
MNTRRFGSYFLFIACFCFSIQSCCKEYCSDDNIFVIDFQGFTSTDLEKIKIVRFVQDDPGKPVDSFMVSTNNIIVKDTTRIYLDTPLTSDFDFKIKVENPSLIYSLSDFVVEKENCRCSSGTYKKIMSYKLNGIQRSTPNYYPLEIRK